MVCNSQFAVKMRRFGNVQQKISCVLETYAVEKNSTKRGGQSYSIVAGEKVREQAVSDDIQNALVSEKLDGTCCFVNTFQSKPWLRARHDRKPTKSAAARFKKFQTAYRKWEADNKCGTEPKFSWDFQKDFKEAPTNWIPATGIIYFVYEKPKFKLGT